MPPTHNHLNNAHLTTSDVIKKKPSFNQEDADHPPDSYSIPKHAEFDWFVRNAFFERSYSTKANNSASASNTLLPPPLKQLRKSDSSIIWIPKTQSRRSSTLTDTKIRRAPPSIRLVPRRNDAVAKTEPSSPKVSCTGRVKQKKNQPAKKSKKKKETSSDRRRESSGTLWTRLREVFRSGKLKAPLREAEAPAMMWRIKRSKSSRVQQSSIAEPVSGSLTRFASGRKSDSWILDMKTAVEEIDTLRFDQQRIDLLSRRNFNSLEPLDCVRDWLDSGPASV